jgi:hypothetical protein
MPFKRNYLYVLFAASLLFFIQPAWAGNTDSDDKPWKKFNVDLGYSIAEYQNKFKPKFSAFLRQHSPCAGRTGF